MRAVAVAVAVRGRVKGKEWRRRTGWPASFSVVAVISELPLLCDSIVLSISDHRQPLSPMNDVIHSIDGVV